MLPLIGLALLLTAALLLLFMRTLSDVLLTLTGLFISLIWIIGAEGWLGPNALGLIGPPNSLTAMAPIIVISLTVTVRSRPFRTTASSAMPASWLWRRSARDYETSPSR